MEQNMGGAPAALLAIRIIDVSTSSLHQHACLPPTAFAKIIAWSHGQVSIDTTPLSEWGNAKPVFLPIHAGAGAAVELEISLWDKPQTGNALGVVASIAAVLLDVGAEVALPAPNQLGDSEQEAFEKIFPLEAHSRRVGTITLHAWKAIPGEASIVLEKDAMLSNRTASTDARSNPGCQTTSGSDSDEKLFFELSESSGSNGNASTIEKARSGRKTFGGFTSTADVASCGHLGGQQENVPHLQGERPSTESGPDEPRDGFEPTTAGPEKSFTLATPENDRRASAQSAATGSSSEDSPGSVLFDSGAALRSSNGVHNASEAAKEFAEAQPQSLDLVAAMLPLIPSFPEGSAEVRVRVRGIRIPCTGRPLATPPYVRASIHPGAHRVARTCVSSIGPTSTSDSPSVSTRRAGIPLVEQSPAERIVEYLFGGEDDGGADGAHPTIALPLGPRVVQTALNENGGASPPRIRLEIVSGRSLGWCDLALPEALRRPGSVVRKLQVPVWRKGWWAHGHANGYDGFTVPSRVGNSASGHLSSPHRDDKFVGEIVVDLGVMLSGEPWPSPSGSSSELEITKGTILVEAATIRTRDVEKGARGMALSAMQGTKLIGVSSRLALGGGEPELAVFHAEGHRRSRTEEAEAGYPAAQGDVSSHDGKVALMTACAELDVLMLRLVQREGGRNLSSHGGSGVEQGQGGGGGGRALMIAVSDINDVFDGRWQWVTMPQGSAGETFAGQKGVHSAGGKDGEVGRGEGCTGRRLEVMLRISLAGVGPTRPHHRTLRTGGRPSDDRSMPLQTSDCVSDFATNQKLRVAAPPKNGGAAPRSALEAWITSPGIGCAQAIAVLPSKGTTSSSGPATVRPNGGTTATERVVNSPDYSGEAGPGIFELEVLAIHGQGKDLWPETVCDKENCNRERNSASMTSRSPSPWWVRIKLSNGGRREGGSSGVSSIDSPPGELTSFERSQARGGGTATTIAHPPLNQDDAEWLGFDWTAHWPTHGGVLVKYPVHWTLSQNELPVVSFEVFRGQTLTARSMLELPPIAMRRQDRPLEFFHPCLGIDPSKPGASKPSTSKNSDDNVILDLRCSFKTKGGKRKRQDLEVGNALTVPPGAHPRPSSETSALPGGILCIQVATIRRLHRSVRSALALPCSIIFSLPHQQTESSPIGCNNRSYGSGGELTKAVEANRGTDGNRTKEQKERRWGDREGDIVVLRVEPRKHRRVVILVALFGGKGDDSDTPGKSQSVLGSTWLPISDNVMERGHLEDRWYPLRVAGRGWNNASKACDIRLMVHFIPALQHPVAGLSFQGPSARPDTDRANPNTEFLTIVLEEGRHLRHPDLMAGPFELFGEITVDYQLERVCESEASRGTGGCRPKGEAVRSKMMVGPLPLREAPRSHEGRDSRSAAPRLGSGASPCWQHVVRIPLPVAATSMGNPQGAGGVFYDPTPTDTPGVTGRGREGKHLSRAMLSVAIKSAARRVATRYPSPVPRTLLTSCSDGHAQQPEERIAERCLLLGVARIRLPPDMFQHGPEQRDGAPVRGWYTVKDESSGVHRGQVRLSIFPASTSTSCARHDGTGHVKESSNTGEGSKSRHLNGYLSLSKGPPRVVGSYLRQARDSGNTDGYISDFCERSMETNEAVVALRRAREYDPPDGLQGAGLLFVSIGDLDLRSSRKGVRQPPPATLVGASVSLRTRHRSRHHPHEGRPHHLTETRMDRRNPSGGGDGGCAHGPSSSALDSREFGGVIAVDRYCSGSNDYPALYVQGHVRTPHRPSGATFHGVVPLESCLMSAGIAIQEKKGLMKMERQTLIQGTVGHTTVNAGDGGFSGGHHDDGSGSTETPWTSGSEQGSRDAEGMARARRNARDENAGGLCTVTVTTSFVPHARGSLEVDPIQLSLIPPSQSDLERWRQLAELRERTEPERRVWEESHMGLAQGQAANDPARGAFLRLRILPAGPWTFSRTFPLKHPRPADWVRDPSSVGMAHLPGGACVFLEVNTAIHAIARERNSTPSSSVSSPAAGEADSRQDCGVEVEPPTLEVCLFDNGQRSASSLAPPSSSALLAIGTVVLTPIIFSSMQQEEESKGDNRREVPLFDPGSGKSLASAFLGISFSSQHDHHAGDMPIPIESQRVTADAANTYSGRLLKNARFKMTDVARAIWALKNIFYTIDPANVGFVRIEDILAAVSDARWLEAASISDLPHDRGTSGNVGIIPGVATDVPSETQENDDAETLLTRLKRLGVGAINSNGGDNAEAPGAGLAHIVRHLLAPPDSNGDGELVSWEVWAALSELIVCRTNHGGGTGDPASVPPVTAAWVWQRAEEIRRASTTGTAHPAVDDIETEGSSADSQRRGTIGTRSAAGFAGFASFASGFGDVSFWADYYSSSAERKTQQERCTAAGTSTSGNTTRKTPRQTAPVSVSAPRGRPNSAPQALHTSKGRLKQTLATARRSWSLRPGPQRRLRRGPGSTRCRSRALRHSSSSPSHRSGAAFSRAACPSQGDDSLLSRCFSERDGVGEPAAALRRRRPRTAPVEPEASRPASKGPARPTTCAGSVSCRAVQKSAWIRGVGGELQSGLSGNSTGFLSQGMLGARDTEEAVADGGGSGLEWRRERMARDEMEEDHLWTETASAKRKAADYQACMLEAQRALGKEHRRVLALEERALGAEVLLLQRDRVRIREEARARTRFMQVQVEIARRNERVTSKNERARVEAAAATRLQWIAKGYLQRCRFKAEMLSIRALQRGGRSVLHARRRHHFRLLRELAALLLQRVWRGRSARKRLSIRQVRVTLVQAVIRGHQQRARISDELRAYLRCRNEAATVLQKHRRHKVSRTAFLLLRGASVKVQCNHRRWRAQRTLEQRRLSVRVLQRAGRHFVFKRFRTKAATLLQKFYRLQKRIKHCRCERKAILDAAGVIQQAVRAWVARRVVSRRREKRRMDRAAATLQRALWGHVCRRKAHRRKVIAALTLWKFMGGLSVKLSQMRKRRRSSAASRVQSAFRMHRARLRLSALRGRRREILAALKIQAVTRGHRSREKTKDRRVERRKKSAACAKIQAASRGHSSRAKTRNLLLQRQRGRAATGVQTLFRGYRSRVETRSLRAKRRADTLTIQSAFWRQWREKIHTIRRQRARSALVVQRAWRKLKTSGNAKSAESVYDTNCRTNNAPRVSTSSAKQPSPKTRRALNRAALDGANLQLVLETLANGVASCSIRTPSDTRQLHTELALREEDPILERSLCRRLSGLETVVTASNKCPDGPTEIATVQWRNGERALLQSLRVLEEGLSRPSE